MKNERTSKRVAKLAAKVLASDGLRTAMLMQRGSQHRYAKAWYLQWSELKALAASCLTQVPDHARVKRVAGKPISMLKAATSKPRKFDDRGFDPCDGGKIVKHAISCE